MKHLITSSIVALLLIAAVNGNAADQTAEEILKTIVKVRAVIHDDAVTAQALGTEREGNGVLIDSAGHILTIGYLILEAKTIEVTGSDGQVTEATFVGYDYDTGFGLLRVDNAKDIKPMKLGKSSDLKAGDPALVAGHKGSGAVSGVRVAARRKFTGYWEYLIENAIYTIPPYQNYGGAALIGNDGSLLGIGSIFTRIDVPGMGTLPANMFVPIDLLKPILTDLKTAGRSRQPQRPWLGMHTDESHGRVFVIRLHPGGPAQKANLQIGDLVLKVSNQPVEGQADFFRKVWALGTAGVEVPISILRGTEIQNITVRSDDRYKFLKLDQVVGGKKETL
jgi:S1-C subfamily serine protease